MISEYDAIRIKLVADIETFEKEINTVYSNCVLPHWEGELHGFPNTLYGYIMRCFSLIDLFSAYWQGNSPSKGQTQRMINFMQKYLIKDREICSVAVQIWRHKLMHTAHPRGLIDERTNKIYRWLLQWGQDHLPYEQHFTFSETSDSKILNIGLMHLLRDIKKGLKNYLTDLSVQIKLQENFETVQIELESSQFKKY